MHLPHSHALYREDWANVKTGREHIGTETGSYKGDRCLRFMQRTVCTGNGDGSSRPSTDMASTSQHTTTWVVLEVKSGIVRSSMNSKVQTHRLENRQRKEKRVPLSTSPLSLVSSVLKYRAGREATDLCIGVFTELLAEVIYDVIATIANGTRQSHQATPSPGLKVSHGPVPQCQ
jgi:hypothetical protein